MGYIVTSLLDAVLDGIADCDQLDITTDEDTPTDLTNSVASVAMSSGDFQKEDDDVGRKLIISAKSSVALTDSGTVRNYVLSDSGTIIFVLSVEEESVTYPGNINIPQVEYIQKYPT
jgi:hypothetical protein